ncbi:MAG: hypothetical protein ACR2LZ_03835 [Pyrinomonadaceae bacterium]
MKGLPQHQSPLLPIILAATIVLATPSLHLVAQTNQTERLDHGLNFYEPWYLPSEATKQDTNALKARWKAIGEEVKSTPNEFAGTYRDGGEMRGSVLRWAPESGFVYVHVYEWFSVIDFSYGKVSITPSEIIFTVEREQQIKARDDRPRKTSRRWITARLKHVNHFIPLERIADFGNYIAGLGEYNDFNGHCCEFVPFLVGENESAKRDEAKGLLIPEKYKRFIKQPIEATIKYVGRKKIVKGYTSGAKLYGKFHEKASLIPVRVNAGARHGVKRGLLFRLINTPGDYDQFLKITRVGPAFADGVVVRDIDDDGGETYYDFDSESKGFEKKVFPPVVAGTKVTTSPIRF